MSAKIANAQQQPDQEQHEQKVISHDGSADEMIAKLQQGLEQAKEQTQRSIADYKNLVRRTQEERSKLFKLASKDFVSELLQPFDHLRMAAHQLDDVGLNMVIEQLWRVLNDQGLETIEVKPGQEFDIETMEAINKQGDGEVVTKVQAPGYRLNGDVIRFAKVSVGSAQELDSNE